MLRNSLRLWSTRCLSYSHQRFLSSAAAELTTEEPKKRKKENKTKPVIQKDILKHFSKGGREKALEYPPSILSRSKKNKLIDGFYIADEYAVDAIFEAVVKDLPDDKPLYEVNPGLGLLSKRLLNQTKNKIVFCEPDKMCFEKMNDLVAEYPNRELEINNFNYIQLWKLEFLDKFDQGGRVDSLFKNIKRNAYFDDTVMRVFACVGSHNFFRDLINSVVFQNSFMLPGRAEYILCIPPSVYLQATCSPSVGHFFYRQMSVLFQILFEYEYLGKINRKYFVPWITNSTSLRKQKLTAYDGDDMYLVRVVPRKNIYQYCSSRHMPALWFFIKQHLRSRSKPVIPMMERWIPGCGLRLIVNAKPKKTPSNLFPNEDLKSLPDFYAPCQTLSVNDYLDNLHVFTQYGSLTPMQILTIFDQFIHWPEYESSAFGEMLEKHIEKMYANPDENSHEIDSDDEEESEDVK